MQLWWSGDDCRKGNGYGIVPTIALSRFHAARVLLLVEPADGMAARHLRRADRAFVLLDSCGAHSFHAEGSGHSH